jgi:hypothetical protein
VTSSMRLASMVVARVEGGVVLSYASRFVVGYVSSVIRTPAD